ncbi:hypothetical protein EIP91_004590 [Steccherinum ochraceum]|uniref:Gti1/Pac2 family-domain-containing protein n=1 Tax=Steccherinum ochraceum TaxID=92696 RepID=A0A4R0R8H9_9APHY|nr:hypothetical protein EIP91_004590 [Steccherinum ochraceum]
MIRSGAIFVFSVDESGIKRWTEGLQWSPSRIAGNFLVYKEVSERAPQRGKADPAAVSKVEGAAAFKPYGLCKKTITVKIEGSDHHLVSYFTVEDVETGRLRRPTSRPDIMSIEIPPELVQSTNFRYPPQIEAGPDGRLTRIRDIEETSQPFEEGHHTAGNRHHSSTPSHSQRPDLPPSPTAPHYAQSQGVAAPTHFHSPAALRSISQHPPLSLPSPTQTAYGFYGHGAHHTASSPEDSPHSPLTPPYSPFEALPAHAGNQGYTASYAPASNSYPSTTQQAPWSHTAAPMNSSGDHASTRLHPDADAWGVGQSIPGQPLASAPPMPTSIVSNLPTRRREHARTRSTPSTWTLDHNHEHGFHVHAPVARYSREARRGPTSPTSGYTDAASREEHM